jgi:hypothetical protein
MADHMHQVHPYFHDEHPAMELDEMAYADLLHAIDPRDLPHRDYAPLIRYCKYVGTDNNIMKFYVPTPTPQKYQNFSGLNLWTTFILWEDWPQMVADRSVNAVEAARLILWGSGIKVHCPCPSYKFYGYQYIDTQLGIAIIPEPRYPDVKNPDLRGVMCKHLRRVMKILNFHLGDMASEIKKQRLSLS